MRMRINKPRRDIRPPGVDDPCGGADKTVEVFPYRADPPPGNGHGAVALYLPGVDIDEGPLEDNQVGLFFTQGYPDAAADLRAALSFVWNLFSLHQDLLNERARLSSVACLTTGEKENGAA